MTSASQNSGAKMVAVRLSGDSAVDGELARHLDEHPDCAYEKFAPKDDDELNQKLCDGEFAAVIYYDMNSALASLWKGHANFSAWRMAGVEIRFLHKPDGDLLALLPGIQVSIEKWRTSNRRRQVLAAFILSGLTLAAMSMLFALLGPAR